MTLLAKVPHPLPPTYGIFRRCTLLEVHTRVDNTCYVLWSKRTGRVLLSVVSYFDVWYSGVRPSTPRTSKASA